MDVQRLLNLQMGIAFLESIDPEKFERLKPLVVDPAAQELMAKLEVYAKARAELSAEIVKLGGEALS